MCENETNPGVHKVFKSKAEALLWAKGEMEIKQHETKAEKLIRDLAQALLMHHAGHVAREPYARTYDRDKGLINQTEDFLIAAEGKLELWPEPLPNNEPNEGSL